MSFRKRNLAIRSTTSPRSPPTSVLSVASAISPSASPQQAGVRASPLDGRPTTSTGLSSLDALLAGHSGLPLGTTVLIEEQGTTDYAGVLGKCYVAEGVVQAQKVFVVGMQRAWARGLPGVVDADKGKMHAQRGRDGDEAGERKMKIAWRYEGLGDFDHGRRGPSNSRTPVSATEPFTHTFDLSTHLIHASIASIVYLPVRNAIDLSLLSTSLSHNPQEIPHRLYIPSLLHPSLYPPTLTSPHVILPFFHTLRSLTRQYPTTLTVLTTMPLSLYSRASGLVRWCELLSDSVFTITPFPHTFAVASAPASTSRSSTQQDKEKDPDAQGLLQIHRLPIFHEHGGGTAADVLADNWSFALTRHRFVVKKYSLPPTEREEEAGETMKRVDLEF